MPAKDATRALERAAARLGFARVAGVDEVGRGCLAGPVMAGAVVLDPDRPLTGLRDSKLLSARARNRLCSLIRDCAAGWAVAAVEPVDIDRLNIHQATLLAMRRAVLALVPLPDLVLVDAFRIPNLWIPQRAVVGGDRRSASIAAASIVAKVLRDSQMEELDRADPRYGFAAHKGYGTPSHLAALRRHGYGPAHRRSFRPASLLDLLDTNPPEGPHD